MRRVFVAGVWLLLGLSFSAGCSKKSGKPKPDPGASAPLSEEVCARVTEHAAKIAGVPVETMNAPGEKGCGDITQPLADCILAAQTVEALEACRPPGMSPR